MGFSFKKAFKGAKKILKKAGKVYVKSLKTLAIPAAGAAIVGLAAPAISTFATTKLGAGAISFGKKFLKKAGGLINAGEPEGYVEGPAQVFPGPAGTFSGAPESSGAEPPSMMPMLLLAGGAVALILVLNRK